MAAEGDTKALYGYETLQGSPPPTDKPMRLLSMEYCPYAERARIVLAKKGLDHDIVNVHLSNKPQFLLDANPNGQVPVLLHEGHDIYESEVVVEYLENRFPETASLYPKDPAQRALARLVHAQHSSKVIPVFYKLFRTLKSDDQAAIDEAHAAFHKGVDIWVEQKLGDKPFFGGDEPNIVDILVWPWLYRADFLTRNNISTALPADKFPKVAAWLKSLTALSYIQATMADEQDFIRFAKSVTEKTVGYNIGSKHPFYAGEKAAA